MEPSARLAGPLLHEQLGTGPHRRLRELLTLFLPRACRGAAGVQPVRAPIRRAPVAAIAAGLERKTVMSDIDPQFGSDLSFDPSVISENVDSFTSAITENSGSLLEAVMHGLGEAFGFIADLF
jgi:hypothetical protein